MTDYYPYKARQSLLERCITKAFRDTWNEKDKEIRTEQKNIDNSLNDPMFAYEGFDLRRVNQTFVMPESEIFSKSVLLWKNMEAINSAVFRYSNTDYIKEIYPHRDSFRTSDFNVSQIDAKMSLRQVITMLHAFFTSNNDSLYGVLLHDGKQFFNPLHPINAQAIVRKYSSAKYKKNLVELDSEIYKVVIYTYKDDRKKNNKWNMDDSTNELFVNHLLSILAMLELKSQYATRISDIRTLSQLNGTDSYDQFDAHSYAVFKYTSEIVRTDDSGQSVNDIFIQPVQLINTGIASPYYGIVAQKRSQENGLVGFQLSPMLSCNIGIPVTKINVENDETTVLGLSVCTGSSSNSSEEGRLTLNHANLGSPYFTDTMASGSYQFADICVRMSLGIYSEFFGLPKIDIMLSLPPKPPISFDEFKKNNPSAKFSDYIKAIKR